MVASALKALCCLDKMATERDCKLASKVEVLVFFLPPKLS